MRISVTTAAPARLDALVLPLWLADLDHDEAPVPIPPPVWKRIRAWARQTNFHATPLALSRLHLETGGTSQLVVLAGCGSQLDYAPGLLRKLGGAIAVQMRQLGLKSIGVRFDRRDRHTLTAADLRAFAMGLTEGGYQLKSGSAPASANARFIVRAADARVVAKAVSRGLAIGQAINDVRALANRPGNEAPPRAIAQFARAWAKKHGLRCTIWGRAALARRKCGALLAVAQGSREEPCLITLTHRGRNPKLKPLVVIGKTITFDTGGISLKPGKSMEWMKFDKSGGMTVLGFMGAVASALDPERTVIGILAVAENMPGGGATRPGDVIRSRNGKTIEIVNTDAEGRLVLADALDLAGELDPWCMIDLATLTGAANVALGRHASALLGNNEALQKTLIDAGLASGDRVWPLPLFPEYNKLLQTPFADLKNIGDGSAGTIVGAAFLRVFVPDRIPWAHIDLTSAWEERATAHGPAGATLFGVALLAQWLESGDFKNT